MQESSCGGLERRERFGLRGEQACVLGDADHGEDLGEVGGEAEGVNLLAGVIGFHEELDDEGDAARVDVVDLVKSSRTSLTVLLGSAW